jgi:ribokinase
VRLLVRIGDDVPSHTVCKQLGVAGVALDAMAQPGMLCRAVILVDPGGEKRLLLYPGVSMYPTLAQIEAAGLDGVTWVHTAPYERDAASLLAVRCRERDIPWSIDLEPATFPDGIDQLAGLLEGASAVFCNARAAAMLGPDPVATLRGLGVRNVILTQAACGATLNGVDRVAAPPGQVLDTTGAGDCLSGWFVAGRLAGADAISALRQAVAAATFSCGRAGAQASFPTRADLIVPA